MMSCYCRINPKIWIGCCCFIMHITHYYAIHISSKVVIFIWFVIAFSLTIISMNFILSSQFQNSKSQRFNYLLFLDLNILIKPIVCLLILNLTLFVLFVFHSNCKHICIENTDRFTFIALIFHMKCYQCLQISSTKAFAALQQMIN